MSPRREFRREFRPGDRAIWHCTLITKSANGQVIKSETRRHRCTVIEAADGSGHVLVSVTGSDVPQTAVPSGELEFEEGLSR